MLYDDFLNMDYKYFPVQDMVPSFKKFNDVLKHTPKYSLSADVMQMVETLSWKRPKSILEGLPVCIMPFPKIWVEFVYQDFVKALDRIKGKETLSTIKEAPAPFRMGYLIEQLRDGYIQATLGWIHRKIDTEEAGYFRELLHLCPVCWVMNTQKEYLPHKRTQEWTEPFNEGTYMFEFKNSSKDVAAFKELSRRSYPGITRFCQDYYNMMVSMLPDREWDRFNRLIQFDVGGEWRHILAILMILNSRTCVEYDTVKREKLSKNRVKAGKPPVDNYKEVKFKLSRVQYNAYVASGRKLEDLTKHLVAAHLKVRKTGVFLWSAHVRGYVGDVKVPKKVVVP
jgi:hypothetical protein